MLRYLLRGMNRVVFIEGSKFRDNVLTDVLGEKNPTKKQKKYPNKINPKATTTNPETLFQIFINREDLLHPWSRLYSAVLQ